jgi:hypothetical protein
MTQKSNSTPATSEKLVRDIRRATRKQYSAEENIGIVLDGLRGETSIAELPARRHRREHVLLLVEAVPCMGLLKSSMHFTPLSTSFHSVEADAHGPVKVGRRFESSCAFRSSRCFRPFAASRLRSRSRAARIAAIRAPKL